MTKELKKILELITDYKIIGDCEKIITGIEQDSRKVVAGTLFVCMNGAKVDGHDFAIQAIEKGANTILAEKEITVPPHITLIVVSDVRETIKIIVPYFYDYPGTKMRIIGITGTNGKTTTSYLTKNILQKAGYKVGVIGTIQIMIENEILPINNTTPDVIELQQILYKMYDAKIDYVVMEISSHALELERIICCEIDVAAFTNLTQDHLDFHKTIENYTVAKAKLFKLLTNNSNVKASKSAVINVDDKAGISMLAATSDDCNIITYGINNVASLKAENVQVLAKGASFEIKGLTNINLTLKITGIFNVYNVLAAVGIALAEKVEAMVIKEALEEANCVAGRFELVDEGQDFSVIVDYAHTPDGLENILKTAREITTQRIITVFGCGGDRDRTKRPIMGKIATELSDIVIATSDNPRTEDPEFILSEIEAGILPVLGAKSYEKITERYEAIKKAIKLAQKDDIVIIAGKGHENYQILKNETIHFDDRETAGELLREINNVNI